MERMSKKGFNDTGWETILSKLPIELVRTEPDGSGVKVVATVMGTADNILDLTNLNPVLRRKIENLAALNLPS